MSILKVLLLTCLVALPTRALPITDCSIQPAAKTPQKVTSTSIGTTSITPQLLTSIDPKTSSCAGAPFPSECADATRAAPAIAKSFQKYGITSPGEQAALIAIMDYESGSFQYNKNHYPAPGRPGQGTKNMQMANFNTQYATSLFGAAAVTSAGTPDKVLALVSGDDASFGSAAWYLSTKCTATVRTGLAAGTPAGWDAYLTQCVGTTHTADRDVAWQAALKALGAGS